jgi:predicted nuclease of predicted toxin-antitoxin system
MKLLIDENLPKRLKLDFAEHAIYTVRDKGWQSKENGELLALMLDEEFDALLTFDKNIQYQQNFETYPIPVIILNAENNTYLTIKPLIPQIHEILSGSSNLNIGPNEISDK